MRHCLEKNPEQRFHSAHDLAFDIEALSGTSGQAAVDAGAAARCASCRALLVALGLLAGAALAYSRSARRTRGRGDERCERDLRRLTNLLRAPRPRRRFRPTARRSPSSTAPARSRTSGSQRVDGRKPIDLTPDCDRDELLAGLLARRNASSPTARSAATAASSSWAPPARTSRRLANVGSNPAWSPDGSEIVFSTEAVASPYGRTGTSEIWARRARRAARHAEALRHLRRHPAERLAARTAHRLLGAAAPAAASATSGRCPYKGLARRREARAGDAGSPRSTGTRSGRRTAKSLYFLSNRDGAMNLWRVPIDEATGKHARPAQPERLPAREVGGLALSRDGRYVASTSIRETTYAHRPPDVRRRAARLIGKPEEVYESSQEMADFDVSSDGKLLAFDSRGGAQDDIFTPRIRRHGACGSSPTTSSATGIRAFSPDGKRIAFHSDRSGRYDIWTIATDGSGLAQMTKTTGDTMIEPLWSPDGRHIAVNSGKASFVIHARREGRAGKIEQIPEPTPEHVLPAAGLVRRRPAPRWAPSSRLPDRQTFGLGFYSPATNTASEPSAASRRPATRRRGSFLGNRAASTSTSTASTSPTSPPERNGSSCRTPTSGATTTSRVAARRPATPFARRDNADIWLRTAGETKP